MNNQVAKQQNAQPPTTIQSKSLLGIMASKFHINADQFKNTVLNTCFPNGRANTEELAAFLMVANEYSLNPLTKEIYAFPAKGGGIVPIVSIDGWMNLINSNPQFDGMEFDDQLDDKGNLVSVTCKIFRKDRSRPTSVTEYMDECIRPSIDTWKKWPRRMLRHKAAIQCARYAFGFSGIYDPDEGERIKDVNPTPTTIQEKAQHHINKAQETIDALTDEEYKEVLNRLEISAEQGGMEALQAEWSKLTNSERAQLSKDFKRVRTIAEDRDAGINVHTGEVIND